jgi:hypothetical protein
MKKYLAIFLIATFAPAAASESVYTTFNIKNCKQLNKTQQEDGGGQWWCKGLKGFDVLFSEGDLRGTLAFGPSAEIQCAAAQSFSNFNSPGPKVEWRLTAGKPIATIMRWFTDNGEKEGKQNWLVVTKINGDDVCRTAIIDTKFPNANKVAQQKADGSAGFNCAKDLVEITSTKSFKIEEVMSGVPCNPP